MRFATAGGDHHLVGVKQPFRTLIIRGVAEVGVSAQLLNTFRDGMVDVRGLAFDDCQRQAVHKKDKIRDDGVVRACHPELVCDKELVVGRIIKINDAHGLPFTAFAQILLHRKIAHQGCVHILVGFHQGGGGRVDQATGDFAKVVNGDPGIYFLDRGVQAVGQDNLFKG
ncbi:hypothetical protein GMJAKD_02645 [Candidatus Electrothrix aarhusensis]